MRHDATWIELNIEVHMFGVDDQDHLQKDRKPCRLKEILCPAAIMIGTRYIPDTKFHVTGCKAGRRNGISSLSSL
jgi:hypothetical protein